MKTYGLTCKEIEALEKFICDNKIKDSGCAYKNGNDVVIELNGNKLVIPVDTLLDGVFTKEYSVADLERLVTEHRNRIFFDDILKNESKCVYFNIDRDRKIDDLKKAIKDLEEIINGIKLMYKIKKELARIGVRFESIINIDARKYYEDYISISVTGMYLRGRKLEKITTVDDAKRFLEGELLKMKKEVKNRENLTVKDKDVVELLNEFYK